MPLLCVNFIKNKHFCQQNYEFIYIPQIVTLFQLQFTFLKKKNHWIKQPIQFYVFILRITLFDLID